MWADHGRAGIFMTRKILKSPDFASALEILRLHTEKAEDWLTFVQRHKPALATRSITFSGSGGDAKTPRFAMIFRY